LKYVRGKRGIAITHSHPVPSVKGGTMEKRNLARTIVCAAAWLMTTAAYAADPPPIATSTPRVTLRIYDYAIIPSDLLARSQAVVDRVYREIGVNVHWAETIVAGVPNGAPAAIDPRDLIIVILSPRMSRMHTLPEGVVGVAATAPSETGRYAYVLFDRIDKLPLVSDNHVMDVMGLVIAHELGHLLLSQGSHAGTGLMQPVWGVEALRADRGQFGLSREQADVIRRTLQR
jgi:hypothetical protein